MVLRQWLARRAPGRSLPRLLREHIEPHIGGAPIGRPSTRMVREWRATLLANGVSVSVAAQAYRLLRAILTTAVEDDRDVSTQHDYQARRALLRTVGL